LDIGILCFKPKKIGGDLTMTRRTIAVRTLAVALSFMAIIMTVPFSPAEVVAASLGSVVTATSVTVGNTVAPTGTTIFAGDRLATDGPALLNLKGGSRIEMTKAAATFDRQSNVLVVRANEGLLRFNFVKGENVQINAGKYTFTSANSSAHVGELGLNSKGEVILQVKEGAFTTLNNATGARSEVSTGNPLVALDQANAKGAAAMGAAAAARAAGKPEGFFMAILDFIILLGLVGTGVGVGVYEATKSPS
jgi:hypothetical protein